MRAVNLLPRDVTGRRSRRSLSPVALVAFVGAAVVATGLTAGFIQGRSAVDASQADLDAARVQLEATPKPPAKAETADNGLAAERAQRAEALGAAYSKRVAWDRVLRRFSLVLPDDIWLTALTAKAPGAVGPAVTATDASSSSSTPPPTEGAPTAGVPTDFTITGHAYSHEGVARLLSRLDVLPDLTNVQLQTSARHELGARKIIQFTIVADVRTGEAS
jgi:Tfp pilus assembly protein PilN